MAVRLILMGACLWLAGCQVHPPAASAVDAPGAPAFVASDLRRAVPVRASEAESARLARRMPSAWAQAEARPAFLPAKATAKPRRLLDDLVQTQDGIATSSDTMVGRGFAVPSRRTRGIFGTQLRASISFRAPDVWEAGLFYSFGRRWTVGIVGQRLVQERSVSVDGQLIDPNNLASFIDGFTVSEDITSLSVGPFVQFQVLPERGWMPEISVAALALELGTITSAKTSYTNTNLLIRPESSELSSGDEADKYRTIFVSASKVLPLRGSFLRGVRGYGGAGYAARTGSRYATAITGQGDPRILLERKDITRHSFVGWVGAELLLPAGFSGFGEWFTGDECEAGYAFGVRWTSPFGVVFSLGFNECYSSVPQRALDLVYRPGGVGGQPSVVSGGSGLASGGLGYQLPPEEDRRGGPRRR